LEEVSNYWESVVRINDYQKQRFVLTILEAMFNTLAGKKICLFGFAFKADTGDTRESPAIFITKRLLEEKAVVNITDPKALVNAGTDLAGHNGNVSFIEDPYQAAAGCDAVAVVTEWDIYRNLDYEKIFQSMRKPAFIFDGRNILDHKELYNIGFNVYPIGKPKLTHFTKNK
jgi:UDPglucose 6-dehydrogenase